MNLIYYRFLYSQIIILAFLSFGSLVNAQSFPNPVILSTGQGPIGSIDPIWLASPWFAAAPPNPLGLVYISTLINNTCAPGNWVDPATLTPPFNNGNWITGSDGDCSTNLNDGFRYFRLTLNLPPDCNGFSVTQAGSYILNLDGYSDNTISDVFVNGTSTGISGGNFASGGQLNINLIGPWLVGVNYVDVLVYNAPVGIGNPNPYGLLMVANSTSPIDTDGDGVTNANDQCPCDPGNNLFGCTDLNTNTCNYTAIRQAFTTAGCTEIASCASSCSMYFLNPTSLSGTGAQLFAQNLGANLISVQSAVENQCIITALNNIGQAGVIWIGFNDEQAEGNFVWYDQSPITYTNWAPGEPNNAGGNEDYVQIYTNGSWNDLAFGGSAVSVIEVNLCPVINAGNDQFICLNETANLTATNTLFGSSPYTYFWNNGAATQSTSVSPILNSEYIVATIDRYNCATSDTMNVNIYAQPQASFTNLNTCLNTAMNFTNTSSISNGVIQTYLWDFGNGGSTSGLLNPSFIYPSDDEYNVSLTVTSDNGCVSTANDLVSVYPLPIPAFLATNNCFGLQSSFMNTSTISSVNTPNNISTYIWDFGDFGTSNATTPIHLYANAGNYIVQLTAVSSNGCIDSINSPFIVFPLPIANFSVNAECLGNASQFNDLSITQGADIISNWLWTFGDNSTSNIQNPTHAFLVENMYNNQLIVTTNFGCKDSTIVSNTVWPLPSVDFSVTNVCLNFSTSYLDQSVISNLNTFNINTLWSWTFGDLNTSLLQNPSNTYATDGNFNVQLLVTTNNGCSDSVTKIAQVFPKPIAIMNGVNQTGCAPICPSLTSVSVVNNPSSIANVQWEYSNGTIANGINSTTCYENASDQTQFYNVTLFVESDKGCSDTLTNLNYLQIFHLPLADYTYSPKELTIYDNTVQFENNSVNSDWYTWNFNNGSISNESDPMVMFGEIPNTYFVQLTALTNEGCSDTIVKPILIKDVATYWIPNTFTPDGNEINNIWLPIVYSGIDKLSAHIMVFNRWGDMIWESFDMTVGWDGTFHGTLVQEGTYTWKFEYKLNTNDARQMDVGQINLIR